MSGYYENLLSGFRKKHSDLLKKNTVVSQAGYGEPKVVGIHCSGRASSKS